MALPPMHFNEDIMKEIYANAYPQLLAIVVKGKQVPFNMDTINAYLGNPYTTIEEFADDFQQIKLMNSIGQPLCIRGWLGSYACLADLMIPTPMEGGSLWGKVLNSKYGIGQWSSSRIGSRSSLVNQFAWVRDLDLFGSKDFNSWRWFRDGLSRRIGDGSNTRFWLDKWLGSDSLSSKYRRLYNLSTIKEGLICNLGIWEGGIWKWKLPWRRPLFSWEIDLTNSFMKDLNHLQLHINKPDSWDWTHDKSKLYSVKSAYRIITQPDQPQNLTNHHHRFVWKSKAPLKVLSFAWRLFQDRIPTMDALVKRGVHFLNESASLCVFCKSQQESLGSTVGSHSSFLFFSGFDEESEMLEALENDIVFNNAQLSIHKILNSSKVNSWFWVKAQHRKENIIFTDWNTNPLACLNFAL
ncbi:hypothetical protein Lal_00038044 [Lupinus albus]|nr:hypothetical protein Lal_00038044 [Lupinus albus]